MAIRDWLEAFSNDVVEVKEPVATDLEATRFLLRHPRQPVHLQDLHGGEAVGNLWSTRDRVATALRVPKADLLPKLMDAQGHPRDARVVERADFMRHETTDVDLRGLPIPRLFPKDAGRYVTAGVWVAEWEGVRNLSFHRILVLGADRGACRIVPRHLRHMYNEAMKAGGELKVAVCIGLDPWNLLAGGTSVEYGVDESRIASALTQSCLGKPVDMVRIKNGLTVPAEAGYVLEGRLIHEAHEEGPFVDAARTRDLPSGLPRRAAREGRPPDGRRLRLAPWSRLHPQAAPGRRQEGNHGGIRRPHLYETGRHRRRGHRHLRRPRCGVGDRDAIPGGPRSRRPARRPRFVDRSLRERRLHLEDGHRRDQAARRQSREVRQGDPLTGARAHVNVHYDEAASLTRCGRWPGSSRRS